MNTEGLAWLNSLLSLFRTDRGKGTVLFTTVMLLSIYSGTTTIEGAQQVFSPGVGFFVGLVIQSILFLFLVNQIPRDFPVLIKWIIIGFFTVASIYTSFFSHYERLSGTDNSIRMNTYAAQKHSAIVNEFYIPLKSELDRLESNVDKFNKWADEEDKGKGKTQQSGKGKQHKEYQEKRLEAEEKIADIKKIVAEAGSLFTIDAKQLTSLSPQQIRNKDVEALSKLPKKYWPESYKNSSIDSLTKEGEYLKEQTTNKLLLPFYRVAEKDTSAYAALGIASFMDLCALLLGVGIDARKNEKRPLQSISQWISTWVMGWKDSRATLKDLEQYQGQSYPDPFLENAFPEFLTLKLQGKGSDFLEYFLDSIHIESYELDMEKIKSHQNLTFIAGLKLLFISLRNRGWVIEGINAENKGVFKVPDQYSSQFFSWLIDAINNELEQEMQSRVVTGIVTGFANQFREVKIPMPNFGSSANPSTV
jgi:hypothetical protein